MRIRESLFALCNLFISGRFPPVLAPASMNDTYSVTHTHTQFLFKCIFSILSPERRLNFQSPSAASEIDDADFRIKFSFPLSFLFFGGGVKSETEINSFIRETYLDN